MREDERASERAREKGRNREKKGGGEQGPRESKDEAAATRRRGGEETRKDGRGRTLWIRGENAYTPRWYGSAERARVQYLAR